MENFKVSELKTEGSSYAIANREKSLELFEQYLSRPWLGCELSLSIIDTEREGVKTRKEYALEDGKPYTVKWNHVLKKKKVERSAIISSITVPDIGMGFSVNSALAGHPQPEIKYSTLQVQVVLPAAKQDKYWDSPRSGAAQVAAHLGMFGTLYDNQFTTYGTLRINAKKPTVVLALETNVLDGILNYSSHGSQRIQLFAFKGCYFSQPIPSAGSASNTEALSFIINIAFEDYDVMEGVTEASFSPADNLYLNDVAVGKAGKKESYLTVLAKTKLAEVAAKTMSRNLGAGLGYRVNLGTGSNLNP